MNVRFAFDIGETVTFGPELKGHILRATWDGFQSRYYVRWWDDEKQTQEEWFNETELSKPEA